MGVSLIMCSSIITSVTAPMGRGPLQAVLSALTSSRQYLHHLHTYMHVSIKQITSVANISVITLTKKC